MQVLTRKTFDEKLSALEHAYAEQFEQEADYEKLQLIWKQIKELRLNLAYSIILGTAGSEA